MLTKSSLTTRIGIGKLVGLVVGLIGFFVLLQIYPDADWHLRWGILLWYVTMGAVIGMFGVVTWHPVLRLPMPWWVRAPIIGAWLNFVLTFFAYRDMQAIMAAVFGPDGALSSPFWFVLEGAIVAAVMGYCATKLGGEGRATIDT